MWKGALYLTTLGIALFYAAIESRIRERLKTDVEWEQKNPADFGAIHDVKNGLEAQRRLNIMRGLEKLKYKRAVVLRFVFIAILILEVIALQR